MPDRPHTADIVERLERRHVCREGNGTTTVHHLINPDGPEAAAEIKALREERDALLQRPIDLAKMDSIDEDATDRMIAYYWCEQAQEARAALKDHRKVRT